LKTSSSAAQAGAPASWVEEEAPLRPALFAATRRLARRAASSWPVWVLGALLASGLLTYLRARKTALYEVTTVLRVTEAQVAIPGANLGAGTLRAHLNEIVLTSGKLVEVMKRFPDHFRGLERDPASELDDFRNDMALTIVESDFSEERAADDPPRSARVQISYRSTNPEFAYTMAHELADVVIGSTLKRQQADLERDQAAAMAAAARAEADLADQRRHDPLGRDPLTSSAMQRAAYAKQKAIAAALAVRAMSERQVLRFDIVDPGRVPTPVDGPRVATETFFATLPGTLLASLLIAGAFDPRILDAADLAGVGCAALARLPELPRRVAPDSAREGAAPSGAEPPRV